MCCHNTKLIRISLREMRDATLIVRYAEGSPKSTRTTPVRVRVHRRGVSAADASRAPLRRPLNAR